MLRQLDKCSISSPTICCVAARYMPPSSCLDSTSSMLIRCDQEHMISLALTGGEIDFLLLHIVPVLTRFAHNCQSYRHLSFLDYGRTSLWREYMRVLAVLLFPCAPPNLNKPCGLQY